MRPDRVVIGADSEQARDVMRRLYRPLYLIETPILFMSLRDSRTDQVCGQQFSRHQDYLHQRDRRSVRKSRCRRAGCCSRHWSGWPDWPEIPSCGPRLRRILLPEGYAGFWFVQVKNPARRCGSSRRLVDINDRRKKAMAARVIAACGGSLKNKTVAVLGLTFKPNTRRHARCAESGYRPGTAVSRRNRTRI